eukprot:5953300-Amphidinium_carterae.1
MASVVDCTSLKNASSKYPKFVPKWMKLSKTARQKATSDAVKPIALQQKPQILQNLDQTVTTLLLNMSPLSTQVGN